MRLVKLRLLGGMLTQELNAADLSRNVYEGLIGYSIAVQTDGGKDCELIFGSVYTPKLDTIRAELSKHAKHNGTAEQ